VLVPGGVFGRMLESPTVRPERFGGPGEPMRSQAGLALKNKIAFREPAEWPRWCCAPCAIIAR